MDWWFETDPDFAARLEWVDRFVRDEVEPLDHLVRHEFDLEDPVRRRLIPPLQDAVRAQGLWACHLGPELGGPGFGQVRLALLNELLGRSRCAPIVFGCQAPDSGNSEILARYGSDALKTAYLEPLLANRIVSAYSMTEPHGGADPGVFTTTAQRDGDEWVISGEKWFTSHARWAAFLVVLAVTEPEQPTARRMSMFVVPRDSPGVEIVRNVGLYGRDEVNDGGHAHVRYHDVRIPADHLLGRRGQGFAVAQARLGGGRIHHAMRTVGLVRRAFDAMCERAVSRRTKGESLGSKQLVQEMVADSWIDLQQFRLLVLQTAWKIDQGNDYAAVRADIAAVKAAMPGVLDRVASRALHLHGALGTSNDMPFGAMVMEAHQMGLVDGPTEIHKVALARDLLRGVVPNPDPFPTEYLPHRAAEARARYGPLLDGPEGDR